MTRAKGNRCADSALLHRHTASCDCPAAWPASIPIEAPSVPRDRVPRAHLATLQDGNCLEIGSRLPLLSRHLHLLSDEDLSNDGIDIGMENVKRNRKRAGRSS